MSTKSIIKVEGIDFVKVYKHWDGGPKDLLPFLKKFNKQFTEKRGIDSTYKIAQLLRATVRMQKEFDLDSSDTTGYGLVEFDSECLNDYEYYLMNDGSVECSNTFSS